MKILHVMTRFLRGGAEEKTLLEFERLGSDHDYTLATGPDVHPRSLERVRRAGVPHVVIPSLRHYAPWRAPAAIREIRRLLRREGVDLVHTHSTEAGILGREAARRERIPAIVHTIHGLEFSEAHPYPIRRAVVALHRRLAPATTRYFSNAHILTRAYIERGIGCSDQYGLVRSAVDLEEVGRAPKVPLDGNPALLTAGRLAPAKGIEDVIDAAGFLAARWPDLRLHIAGEGPLERALRTRAGRAMPAGCAEFLGHRTDLPGLLKGADAFVFASRREGTPRVLTEALAAGCPVVSTNVDGIPEQIVNGTTGLLVPRCDPAALARATEAVLTDSPATRERVRAGLRHVEAFGVPAMVEALRREYAGLGPGR